MMWNILLLVKVTTAPASNPWRVRWGKRSCAFLRCRRVARSYQSLPRGRPFRHAVSRRGVWDRISGGNDQWYARAWRYMAGARDALADRELGTIVSEHELPAAILRLLATPKPDSVALAAAARARFGREKFARAAKRDALRWPIKAGRVAPTK
jgi:hypothetical protein